MKQVPTFSDLPKDWFGYCAVKYPSVEKYFAFSRRRPAGIYLKTIGDWKLTDEYGSKQWMIEEEVWKFEDRNK